MALHSRMLRKRIHFFKFEAWDGCPRRGYVEGMGCRDTWNTPGWGDGDGRAVGASVKHAQEQGAGKKNTLGMQNPNYINQGR